MSISHIAAPGGKPSKSKSKDYRAPHPGASRIKPVDARTAGLAVYDGRERAGSYRRIADRWLAVDRLGHPLGQYESEAEAVAAIERGRS